VVEPLTHNLKIIVSNLATNTKRLKIVKNVI
jgi:hypothetical protein